MNFSWDDIKAASNLRKHGVSFDEATTVFADPLSASFPDAIHDDRWIVVGRSRELRLLFVVYVDVFEDTVRIISARRATSHERRQYEEKA